MIVPVIICLLFPVSVYTLVSIIVYKLVFARNICTSLAYCLQICITKIAVIVYKLVLIGIFVLVSVIVYRFVLLRIFSGYCLQTCIARNI